MWLATYSGSVSGRERDLLEWFPFDSPGTLSSSATLTPDSVPQDSSGDGCFQDRRFLSPPDN